MKTMRRKSHKLCSNTQNQKTKLNPPQRVAEKNFSGPTYDASYLSSGSYDLHCHHIRELSK